MPTTDDFPKHRQSSSNVDMPLIEYLSSDEESAREPSSDAYRKSTIASSSKKRKRDEIESVKQALPPLPPVFYTLFVASPRTHPCDDPALHGGRNRQVPHVEGNWPTHIYLEWYPTRKKFELLQAIVDAANTKGQVHSLLQSQLEAQLPLHISLSAPLVLRAEQKGDFQEAVESKIMESCVGRVEVCVRSLRWERNADGTRWFLVLGVATPANDELHRLLDSCNECASDFKLSLLYGTEPEKPFHISIAWQLTEPSLKQRLVLAHPNLTEFGKENLQFEAVKLKMGNIVKDLRLSKGNAASS